MKRILFVASAVAASVTVVAGPAPVEALAQCKDSNGSALGGSVYWGYYAGRMTCDVRPPQRLHITQTPSRTACNNMGGHGWTATGRICWDVDY